MRPVFRSWASRTSTLVIATGIIIGLSGCSQDTEQLFPSNTVDKNLTVVQSYEQILYMYIAIKQAAGTTYTWVNEGSSWLTGCDASKADMTDSGQFKLAADGHSARAVDPQAVAERVLAVLEQKGYELRIQEDRDATPGPVLAYPNGYLGGSEADGFGFEIDFDSHTTFVSIDGHCADGKTHESMQDISPPPGSPSNLPPLFPTPLPTERKPN